MFVDDYFKDIENKHNIRNLTLLPQKLNSGVKNNFFLVKRNYIIQKDKVGEFIPIGTKNLFLKYYTSSIEIKDVKKWTKEDGDSYLEEIKKLFDDFFKGI